MVEYRIKMNTKPPPFTKDTPRHVIEDDISNKIKESTYIQGELFTYISNKNFPCTKNANGIFLNLSVLNEENLKDIHRMIYHIEDYNKSVINKVHETELLSVTNTASAIEPTIYKSFSLSPFQRRILNLISS